MRLRLFAVWLLIIFGIIGAWAPSPCRAYVPVAGHLLAAAAAQRQGPATAVVRQTRFLLSREAGRRAGEYTETVYFRFPGVFRSELEIDQGRRVYLERSGAYRIADFRGVSQPPPEAMDLALRLLAHTKPSGMERVLAEAGVDLSVSSLGLFNGRLGFVLGARYPDESVSQVWFDKKTLLPFRWLIIRQNAEGLPERIEIRYFTWQEVGDLRYPRSVEGYRDEQRVSGIRVDELDTGIEIAEERFSFQKLLEDYPSPPPEGGGAEMISPVQ